MINDVEVRETQFILGVPQMAWYCLFGAAKFVAFVQAKLMDWEMGI